MTDRSVSICRIPTAAPERFRRPARRFPGFESDVMQADPDAEGDDRHIGGVCELWRDRPSRCRARDSHYAASISRRTSTPTFCASRRPTTRRVHTFVEGQDVSEHTFTQSGSATGIGDSCCRRNTTSCATPNAGLAVGDRSALAHRRRGRFARIGHHSGKFFLIASSTSTSGSRRMQHLGFTISGKGIVSRYTDSSRSASATSSILQAVWSSWRIRS